MDFLIHHMLRTSAHHLADKEALVHGDQRLSYGEVARRSAGLAKGLRRAGLVRGDRIGIYLDPSIAQVSPFSAPPKPAEFTCQLTLRFFLNKSDTSPRIAG